MNIINRKNSSNAVSNIKNITHLKLSVLLSSILLMLAFAFLSTQALTLKTLLPVLKNLFILILILVLVLIPILVRVLVRVLVRILILILILVITLVLMVLMGVLSKETVSLARKHFLYTVYRLMKKDIYIIRCRLGC